MGQMVGNLDDGLMEMQMDLIEQRKLHKEMNKKKT